MSVLTKNNPSLHFDSQFPTAYYVFKVLTLALVVVLAGSFVLHSFYIFREWHLVINRNKFFFLFSSYFIFFLVITLLSSHFQSYDQNGLKLLFILALYNFYIIVLQTMWKITPKGFEEAKNIFDIKQPGMLQFKNELGVGERDHELDYFRDTVKVEIVNEAEKKKEDSFETYKESEDEVQSVQSVGLTRNRRRGGTEGKSSKISSRTKTRLLSFKGIISIGLGFGVWDLGIGDV